MRYRRTTVSIIAVAMLAVMPGIALSEGERSSHFHDSAPLPTPSSRKPTDRDTAAALSVAQARLALSQPVKLRVVDSRVHRFPRQRLEVTVFTVENTENGERVEVVLDERGKEVDEHSLVDREQTLREQRFGRIDEEFAEEMTAGPPEAEVDAVVWLEPPVQKSPAALLDAGVTEHEIRSAVLAARDRRRELFSQVTGPAVSRLEVLGKVLSVQDTDTPMIVARLPAAKLLQVARWPEVRWVFRNVTKQIPLLTMANFTRYTEKSADNGVHWRTDASGNYIRGQGISIAVNEANGPNVNPQCFDGTNCPRWFSDGSGPSTDIVSARSCTNFNEHAYGVVGVLASSHSYYGPGFAERARILLSGSCDGSSANLRDDVVAAVDAGAPILNISWMYPETGSAMQASDIWFDAVAFNERLTVVMAAGNTGGQVAHPASGFNVITVGAFDDMNTRDVSQAVMASYSARGDPDSTWSDREKPEVVAPAHNVLGPTSIRDNSRCQASWWNYDTDKTSCYRKILAGTSFAAPMISGMAGLIMQRNSQLRWQPEAVKAILIASATQNVDKGSTEKDGAGAAFADYADNIARGYKGGWATKADFCSSHPTNTWRGRSRSGSCPQGRIFTQHWFGARTRTVPSTRTSQWTLRSASSNMMQPVSGNIATGQPREDLKTGSAPIMSSKTSDMGRRLR